LEKDPALKRVGFLTSWNMRAPELQEVIKQRLETYFGNRVVTEWPISKGATDSLAAKSTLYSPRVDVAVYTVGTAPGNRRLEIVLFGPNWPPRN
jgi:hypothetical protein